MEIIDEFKNRFLELAYDLDCKKSEIPALLNIDYNIYQKISELGIPPKPAVLIRIADYFNVSLEYHLGRSKNYEFVRGDTPVPFIERYKELKKKHKLTDYEVARKLHITTSYTTAWKNKNYIPSLSNLMQLSDVFRVSLDYLLGRTDDI